jgi:hypothetical protein
VSLKSFAGWVGLLIGIVGITLSIYFYKKSITKPEPVFLIDPVRTIIVDSKQFFETPLRVVRPSGDEIKGDITSVRFYFWNNGRNSVKKSNILEPLVITLDDPNGEILDYKILKCSRKVVKPVVGLNSVDPNKSLSLSFAILEQEDGLTGQVIYKGNPDAGLIISGVIENVREIITNRKMIKRLFWKKYVISIIIVFFINVPLISLLLHEYIVQKKKPKPIFKIKHIIVLILFIVLLNVALALIIGRVETLSKASTSFIQKVPKDIIP